MILVTWASKPEFSLERLRKLVVSHGVWGHMLDVFALELETDEECLWYYSTVKKLENTIKLYQINVLSQEIVCFPEGKRMEVPSRPAGMSLSKYHGLVWT